MAGYVGCVERSQPTLWVSALSLDKFTSTSFENIFIDSNFDRDYALLNVAPRDFPCAAESSVYLTATKLEPSEHRSQQHISNGGGASSTETDVTEMNDANVPSAQLPSIQRLNSCTSSSSSSGVVTNFHSKSLSQNQSCESSQSNFSTFESLDLNGSESCDLAASLPSCATDATVIAAGGGGGGSTANANDNASKDNGMSLFAQNRYVIRSI